jgi:hypothetical protein
LLHGSVQSALPLEDPIIAQRFCRALAQGPSTVATIVDLPTDRPTWFGVDDLGAGGVVSLDAVAAAINRITAIAGQVV